MSNIAYSSATAENGQRFITVYADGTLTVPVDDTHPNFARILEACHASERGEYVDAAAVLELFDIPATIVRRFERLSARVTIQDNQLCFEGDPAQPGLSKQILRFLDEGNDVEPLVSFMERIMANPSDHSREQAWAWLDNHDFSITPAGEVIAYKGVYNDGNGGYRSGHRGHAFVNDVEVVNDYVSNSVGDVVHMPRSEVKDDPNAACHSGLHVGTYNYARTYAGGAMLRVIIDPRDIVSVPYDASGQKIRVCRYRVDEIIDAPDTTALVGSFEDYKAKDDDSCDLDVSVEPDETEDGPDYDNLPLGTRINSDEFGQGVVTDNPFADVGKTMDEDGDYRVELDSGRTVYVEAAEVTIVEDATQQPQAPMDKHQGFFVKGDTVKVPNGREGVITNIYRGHRGRKATVRVGRGASTSYTAYQLSELTLV